MDETDRRLVRLAGRLSVAQVPELLGACANVTSIQLDLTDLVSVDVAGIEALQRLRDQGADADWRARVPAVEARLASGSQRRRRCLRKRQAKGDRSLTGGIGPAGAGGLSHSSAEAATRLVSRGVAAGRPLQRLPGAG